MVTIHVTILEDEKIYADILMQHLRKWGLLNHIIVQISCFAGGKDLSRDLIDSSDIMFFDIELTDSNGLQAAEFVRQHNKKIPIVFTTNHQNYVFEGYAVQAFRFLLKPISEGVCFTCMQQAVQYHEKKQNNLITIENKKGLWRIPINNILYIEACQHYINVVTTNKIEYIRKSFTQLLKELPECSLVQCHRSYMVNCDHIYSIRPEGIILDNDDVVLVSDTFLPKILSQVSNNLEE